MPPPLQRSACDRCHAQKLRCIRPAGLPEPQRPPESLVVRPSELEFVNAVTPADDTTNASAIDVNSSLFLTASPIQLAQPYSLDTELSEILQPDQSVPAWATAHTENPAAATGALATTTSYGSRPSGLAECGGRTSLFDAQLGFQKALETWQPRFNRERALLSTANETITVPGVYLPQLSHESTTAAPSDDRLCEEKRQLDVLSSTRSLSDLNVQLFALVAAIPRPPFCKTELVTWKNKDVAIDKTFQPSHRFIEVLNKLSPRYLEAAIHESDAGEIQGPEVDVDQAPLLLILPCYQRLVDAYRNMFGNDQACLDRSFVTAREYVRMLEVKVGSFALPDSSALQITLILQLARHLLQHVGAIIKCIEEKSGSVRHGECDLLTLTFNVVSTKEDELVGKIAVV
ncbi:fungal transcriptional regulatory protein [Colletotrichum incanum]|uniref:Fungal transcriptional regulatory protein n=1 Tax=Colletotrichum incanum TaxID=1573173 RepID=A0A166ZMT4_COLIC|nr:fungal transcriptional regulatory protein [Colletotrichum incanum]